MIIVTTPYLTGHRVVEVKGHVFGLVVRSRGLAGNLSAFLRSLVGGEIHEYTSLLEDTRRRAVDAAEVDQQRAPLPTKRDQQRRIARLPVQQARSERRLHAIGRL